jgi:predicted transcriptional regulator
MSKKRNRLEVIYDILKAISNKQGEIKPTHIMYKSNLSHKMLEQYLSELLQNGLIIECHKPKGKTYNVTSKGFDYLNKYRIIKKFTDSFSLE